MVQLYLKQVHPRVRLYVSPINFDPLSPAAPVSEPENFVTRLAEAVGRFATIGFAEAFKALSHGVLSDEEYRRQALGVLDEHERLLDHALNEFRGGLLFVYFSSSDLMAHMFWWRGDDKHPTRSPEDAAKYNAVIEELYERLDANIGRAMSAVGDDATVIVMSDHGFNNWGRKVNLNNWLRDEGYLVARDPQAAWPDILRNTDWTQTRAYAVGLNGLYVNLKGREKDGGVEAGAERDALLDEITKKLLALRDPDTGAAVVQTVYRAEEVFRGPRAVDAPDLVIGYARNYRVSGDSGLGKFEEKMIADNTDAWSADHCIAAELVPGILVTNRPIAHPSPRLIDIAPTLLAEFGVAIPDTMRGRSIFETSAPRVARR
jgi:predicted AlkP superfamily phosphohydrolase/phosphomutase